LDALVKLANLQWLIVKAKVTFVCNALLESFWLEQFAVVECVSVA